MREVEELLRIRHNLRLDSRTTSTCATQDAVLKVWDQISQATFLALVVISSIALMVGGIGVMAIMMISVTERTREIGVRKALGARRREILWQFLIEAAFLTSMGGVLGIIFGSAHRPRRPLAVRLPGLAALVVVRHRHRLLRQRRHLLRPLPRHQSLAAGPDRSAALRVGAESLSCTCFSWRTQSLLWLLAGASPPASPWSPTMAPAPRFARRRWLRASTRWYDQLLARPALLAVRTSPQICAPTERGPHA